MNMSFLYDLLHNFEAIESTGDQKSFGYHVLGPIFEIYCRRLHSLLQMTGTSKPLFCTRSGYILEHIFATWLRTKSIKNQYHCALFPISRIAAFRASLRYLPIEWIQDEITKIINQPPLQVAISFFSLDEQIHIEVKKELEQKFNCSTTLQEIIYNKDNLKMVRVLKDEIMRSGDQLYHFLESIDNILLIDSGWAGTTQAILAEAFPEYQFEGAYFGVDKNIHKRPTAADSATGLIFDERDLTSSVARKLLGHRHFFENLLEPSMVRSTSLYSPEPLTRLDNIENFNNSSEQIEGICDYLRENIIDLGRVSQSFHGSINYLASRFEVPSPGSLSFLGGKARSHDMGRAGEVELCDFDCIRGKPENVINSYHIWPAGAAVHSMMINYPCKKTVRTNINNLASKHLLASFLENQSENPLDQDNLSPKVSVITRTKDRPVLLRRCLDSVLSQNYSFYELIIINDGGNPLLVENILLEKGANLLPYIKVIHNTDSSGMEAASNKAIRESTGSLIAVHDDDDTWDPSFLSKMVSFLRVNKIYQGAICHSRYISESIDGITVVNHGQWDYNQWVEYVMMSEMAINNIFPPISFVFSRKAYDEIDGFNESLQVLGDWDFNLRFLALYDIGVVPETIAFYHHRDVKSSKEDPYSNSVIDGIDKHKAYRPIMLNGLLRHPDKRYDCLKLCIATSYAHHDIRSLKPTYSSTKK